MYKCKAVIYSCDLHLNLDDISSRDLSKNCPHSVTNHLCLVGICFPDHMSFLSGISFKYDPTTGTDIHVSFSSSLTIWLLLPGTITGLRASIIESNSNGIFLFHTWAWLITWDVYSAYLSSLIVELYTDELSSILSKLLPVSSHHPKGINQNNSVPNIYKKQSNLCKYPQHHDMRGV